MCVRESEREREGREEESRKEEGGVTGKNRKRNTFSHHNKQNHQKKKLDRLYSLTHTSFSLSMSTNTLD